MFNKYMYMYSYNNIIIIKNENLKIIINIYSVYK